jgi:ribosomal protein S17E
MNAPIIPNSLLRKARPVRAPRGPEISCANWEIEAAYRMIQNNIDPEVAENPDEDMMHRKQKRHGSTAEKLFDEIEERVSGFFNANEGTMTIGEEGFVTKMCKELKEKYNIEPDTMRAEKFDGMVERACHSVMEKYKGHVQAQYEHARMLELSGAGMNNRNATENIKARVAQRKEQALPESEELTAMLKIAGLR